MKKSNWVAFIVAILISAFLLWLWFFLGFDHIDAPLDLVLSIIWWIIIAVVCFAIYRVEKKRQERARTCYVADRYIYNAEVGSMTAEGVDAAVQRMHDVIDSLEYTFEVKDVPKDAEFNYVVRSKKFKATYDTDEMDDVEEKLRWEGEIGVVKRPDDAPIPFYSRDELLHTLTRLSHAAAS